MIIFELALLSIYFLTTFIGNLARKSAFTTFALSYLVADFKS